jgi:putative tryptophan/tyrosine transport system substrate-binding protein
MKRRDMMFVLGGAVTWPHLVSAQQTSRPVIGFLGFATPSGFSTTVAAFRDGLRERGYVEGQNVSVEYRWAEGHRERLPELAADLVSHKVEVIFTSGGVIAAIAAKDATSTIPIVFEIGVDPVERGLVASYARPSGNLTGVTILTADLMPKRLEVLAELVPQARVIALLVNPSNAPDRTIGDVQAAALLRRVQVQVIRAAAEDQFEPAFASVADPSADALLVGNDPFFFSHREQLVALAARHSIPAMYEWRDFVVAGGLISYGTSLRDMYRQAGIYVGRILSGAKPADLPILQPTTFELVINLKTAKTLGLSVPQSLLSRADEVIE